MCKSTPVPSQETSIVEVVSWAKSANLQVRNEARRSIENAGNLERKAQLCAAIAEVDFRLVQEALGKSAPERAIPCLSECIVHCSSQVKGKAMAELEKLLITGSAIATALKSNSEVVRQAALDKITPAYFPSVVTYVYQNKELLQQAGTYFSNLDRVEQKAVVAYLFTSGTDGKDATSALLAAATIKDLPSMLIEVGAELGEKLSVASHSLNLATERLTAIDRAAETRRDDRCFPEHTEEELAQICRDLTH